MVIASTNASTKSARTDANAGMVTCSGRITGPVSRHLNPVTLTRTTYKPPAGVIVTPTAIQCRDCMKKLRFYRRRYV